MHRHGSPDIGTAGHELDPHTNARTSSRHAARHPIRSHTVNEPFSHSSAASHDPARPTGRVDVSVLVPVLNEERHIGDAVRAMQSQRFDGEIEFLFMDGGSEDRTREILEELAREDPRIRVLDNPGRRTPNALNVGLGHARGEYIARMDAHAFYGPDYVAKGIERLRRGDVDWVSGPAVPRPDGRWSGYVALAYSCGLATVGSRKWGEAHGERDLDTGVWAGVWRRTYLEELGGWNVGWPVNQDSELASRVLESGGRIVLLPEMAAEYVPRDDLGRLARQYWHYGFYRAKTACRHPNSMRRSHLLAPGVAAATVAAIAGPRRVRRPARGVLAFYAGAVGAVSARATTGEAGAAARLSLVAGVMHLAWGFGYISGSVRHGPPLRAVAHALGPRGRGRG
jgi:succinoglycan biosynthesis protein ExoA